MPTLVAIRLYCSLHSRNTFGPFLADISCEGTERLSLPWCLFCDRNQQGEGGGQGAAAEEKRQLEREIQVTPRMYVFATAASHGEP